MRIFFGVTLFLATVLLPWYLVLLLWAIYAAAYPTAYELVVFGVLLDALLGSGSFSFTYTLAGGTLIALVEIARPRVRFYARQRL